MPTIIDIVKIPTQLDGRRKITDEQRQEIRRLYEIERQSIHHIARTTGVSRRSVQFILFPERVEIVKARAKEVKRWEKYNTAEYHTPAMQKYRAKKKDMIAKGLIKITEEDLTKQRAKLNKRNLQVRLARTEKAP